jgi:hypothetical protein
MGRSQAIPLGVVVARERVVHPFADVRWRAVDVLLDPPQRADWRQVRRGNGFEHYHAATLSLVLSAQNLMDYRVNLANGIPCIYVVLQTRPGATPDTPVDVRAISASPFDGELFSRESHATVERVPMPPRLVGTIERFIAECTPCAEAQQQRNGRDEPAEKHAGGGIGAAMFAFGRLSPSE